MERTTARGARRLAGPLVVVLALSGCIGQDTPPEPEPEPSQPEPTTLDVEVTGVSAEPLEDGQVQLSWDPVSDVPAYLVGDGESTVEVPAAVCQTDCSLTVAPRPAGESHELSVSAAADNAVSEPTTVDVDVPDTDDTAAEAEELVVRIVFEGDPPEVESVPVESPEEAEELIDSAYLGGLDDDRTVLAAGMGTATADLGGSGSAGAGESDASGESDAPGDPDASGGPVPWQLSAMGYEALPSERPGEGVTVAVIETDGLDATHPVFDGASILDGTAVGDDDRTGLDDPEFHSTAVTSMIAGQPGTTVPGMAPGATVLPVNKAGADTSESIIWAVDNGADVINISVSVACKFGLEVLCPDHIQAGVDYAEENGVVVVASAGNNGDGAEHCDEPHNARLWPAVLDTTISVGGHDQEGERWACSADRIDVDLLAPAAEMLLPIPGGEYTVREGGTSAGAGLVSGLIAAVLSERPDLRPADIRSLLPLWLNENDTINIDYLLETIRPDGPSGEQFEDALLVTDFRVDFAFEGSHPVSMALPGPHRQHEGSPLTSDVGWSTYSVVGPRQQDGVVPFGEIRGLLVVGADGEVTGNAVFSYEHGPVSIMNMNGANMNVAGHRTECLPSPYTSDSFKVFRWDVPVIVRGFLEPGSEEEPALNLTFSLGLGATEHAPGVLPEMTVVHDSTEWCEPGLDRLVGTIANAYTTRYPSFDAVATEWQRYENRMEAVYQALVESSPYTFAEPYEPRYTQHATRDADDDQVRMVIQEADTPRRTRF